MAPKRWTTDAQKQWLEGFLDKYFDHQSKSQTETFWAPMFFKWFEAFPERLSVFGTDHDLQVMLSMEQQEQLTTAIKTRKMVSIVFIFLDISNCFDDSN